MAVKAQRAADCDPFACHVGRRGGEVRIFCGSIASACVLAGWASSRPLAPPALSTFCSTVVHRMIENWSQELASQRNQEFPHLLNGNYMKRSETVGFF